MLRRGEKDEKIALHKGTGDDIMTRQLLLLVVCTTRRINATSFIYSKLVEFRDGLVIGNLGEEREC